MARPAETQKKQKKLRKIFKFKKQIKDNSKVLNK